LIFRERKIKPSKKRKLDKLLNKNNSKHIIAFALIIPLILFFLFQFLNVPSGMGVEVKGITTNIVYIKTKYGTPYTHIVVLLEDMSTIDAVGPPHMKNRLNTNVLLQKRKYFLTGGDAYEFVKYE